MNGIVAGLLLGILVSGGLLLMLMAAVGVALSGGPKTDSVESVPPAGGDGQ